MTRTIVLALVLVGIQFEVMRINWSIQDLNNTQQNMVNAITSLKEIEFERLKAEQIQAIIAECGNVKGTYDTEGTDPVRVIIHCDNRIK